MLEGFKAWEELTTSWIKIAENFCRLKDEEIRSEMYLQLAQTILLAPMKVKVEDEFSVKPRSMIRIFEAWENVYDAVIEACSQDSIQCCTFAIKLGNQLSQMIACEKIDCRLLFIYSQIIRIQIEYFNYDILNDVFVGDFDLSGKGYILGNFCELLIEIRKHSFETLRKHADKQTGIALELMSKSVLNILEAAISLVSLMTKPSCILFVIGALSEFMSSCLALVTEKSCPIFCKCQTKVILLVKTALITLKKHYSGPYDTSLLRQLEPILINGLRLLRLRRYIVNLWQQMFGRASHLNISNELSTALEQAKCVSTNFASEQEAFSVLDSSKASISYDTNLDFAMDESNNIGNKSVNQNFKQSPLKNTQSLVPKCQLPKKDDRNENTEEYVVIDVSHSKKKMQLTDHQKEKLMEKSDSLLCLIEESQSIDLAARIPPGYTDNSSQENSSAMKVSENASLIKKCESEHNCIATSSISVRSKNQNFRTENINENNNHIDDIVDDGNNVDKATMKESNMQDIQAIKFNELCRNDSSDLQNQISTKKEDSGELAIILLDEHMRGGPRKVLEKPILSIRCETPEITESHLENLSPKENADEPMRTPNSILKNCGRRATCPAIKFFSASAKKCKRVHFDASTLDDDDIYGPPRRKIFRRSRNSLFSGLPIYDHSEPTSPSKRPVILPTNKNPADAVFPALVGSEELIPPQIYLKLAPTMSSIALRSLMKSRGVATKNMMSKQDAIELEKIMKRPLNSPTDCLKGVHLQSIDKQEAIFSKPMQELHIIDIPEILDKAPSRTSGNEISNASTKQNYVNPFQNGSKRFTPCSVERLDNSEAISHSSEQSDLKNNQTMPFFEIRQTIQENGDSRSQFDLPHPFVRCQESINIEGSIITAAFKRNDKENSIGSSSLSEHGSGEEEFVMQSTVKLPIGNIENKDLKSNKDNNTNNMKSEGDEGEHYDADDSLRNAYHIFLENPVVAAVAGIFINNVLLFYDLFNESSVRSYSSTKA
ncbi:hypothetical protein X798_03688 [Onchocerca flexuosa]|uniref:Uncharacterized protein n=1 Tax=Onchocerca flexuosa TaxID=387005 RepID=A0A238BWP2_9BILA|nr:hypothetical protein X798_03688 [Onchocerca flexuosa]